MAKTTSDCTEVPKWPETGLYNQLGVESWSQGPEI
jgi:hypothetical protein